MDKSCVPRLLAAVLLMMVAGCMRQPNAAELSLQNVPVEAYVEEGVEKKVTEPSKPIAGVTEAEETPSIEPDAQSFQATKLSIVVGDDVKLETSLEFVTATFDGTEYTLEPYGVTFALRTGMGEPVVEGERIVFSTDLSIDLTGVATITYEVIENTSLNEVVDKELQDHKHSFYGEFIEFTSNGGLRATHNDYNDDSVYSGVFFYEFNLNVLRIEYQCPIAAVDAMVRILNETVDSVKMKNNN